MGRRKLRCCRGRCRTGAAVVEAAVLLPVLALIALGTIEACNMIYLRQSGVIAAYEGVRVAIVPGAESENVQAQIDQIFADRRIQGATVTVSPSNLSALNQGDFARVEVVVPLTGNRFVPAWLISDQSIQCSAEMMCEY